MTQTQSTNTTPTTQAQQVGTDYANKAQTLLAYLQQNLTIQNDEHAAWAADTIRRIRDTEDEIKAAEKTITKPQKQALDAARAFFKGPKQAFERARLMLNQALTDYHSTKAQEQQARLTAAAAANVNPQVLAQVAQVETPQLAGVHTRTTYRAEVVDLSQLPAEYWIPDYTKIQAAVDKAKGNIVIPGVVVHTEHKTVVRR